MRSAFEDRKFQKGMAEDDRQFQTTMKNEDRKFTEKMSKLDFDRQKNLLQMKENIINYN